MRSVEIRRAASSEAWRRGHLKCPYVFRPAQRSTLSRVFLCSYTLSTCRCMFRLCPGLITRPWEKEQKR